MSLNKKLLDILACPKCKGNLQYIDTKQKHALDCRGCRLSYKIEQDIPNMLIEEATEI